jgi:hypothetical protein
MVLPGREIPTKSNVFSRLRRVFVYPPRKIVQFGNLNQPLSIIPTNSGFPGGGNGKFRFVGGAETFKFLFTNDIETSTDI